MSEDGKLRCDNCVHKKVCKYMDTYRLCTHRMLNEFYGITKGEENVIMTFVEPICRHYSRNAIESEAVFDDFKNAIRSTIKKGDQNES